MAMAIVFLAFYAAVAVLWIQVDWDGKNDG